MQFSEEVKATLWKLIDEMSLNVSEFTVHQEKNFTRKKKVLFIYSDAKISVVMEYYLV